METTDFEHFSFPKNMQLNVLNEVIEASGLWERLKGFKFGNSERSLTEFDFGQHCWRSTIKQRDIIYQSPEIPRACYNFINVKIPYSESEDDPAHLLEMTREEINVFGSRFLEDLESTNLFQTKPDVYTRYMPDFSIYCASLEMRQILIITFTDGGRIGKRRSGQKPEDWPELCESRRDETTTSVLLVDYVFTR